MDRRSNGQRQEMRDNILLFPMRRTMAWRPVEATCLRAAGAGNAAVKSAVMHLRLKYSGAPPDLVEPELERVHAYMQARIRAYKMNAGLVPFEKCDKPGDVMVIHEPPPAA